MGLWLFGALLVLCVHAAPRCGLVRNGRTFEFFSLRNETFVSTGDRGESLSWTVCGPVPHSSCGNDAVGCDSEIRFPATPFSLGNVRTQRVTWLPRDPIFNSSWFAVSYVRGDNCTLDPKPSTFSTRVLLRCNARVPRARIIGVENEPDCHFDLYMESVLAC